MRGAALGLGILLGLAGVAAQGRTANMSHEDGNGAAAPAVNGSGGLVRSSTAEETVTLGGGCFWCLEAVFTELNGVRLVESGYSGGQVASPSYEAVCSGTTGHAEVVQVRFDPRVLSLHDLLSVFFTVHDPTTLNRQGADVGTQYRSVIFYRDDAQREVAAAVMREITAAGIWGRPLVTELVPLAAFYKAEPYHQNYYATNPNQGYCRVVIEPKVRKFREKFKDRLVPR